eukprot:12912308-Prorocentrum_lima.AAC.1
MSPASHTGRILITAQLHRNHTAVEELHAAVDAAGGENSGIDWTTETFRPGRHTDMAGPGVVDVMVHEITAHGERSGE